MDSARDDFGWNGSETKGHAEKSEFRMGRGADRAQGEGRSPRVVTTRKGKRGGRSTARKVSLTSSEVLRSCRSDGERRMDERLKQLANQSVSAPVRTDGRAGGRAGARAQGTSKMDCLLT